MLIPNQPITYTTGATFNITLQQMCTILVWNPPSGQTLQLPTNASSTDAWLTIVNPSAFACVVNGGAGNLVTYNNAAATTLQAPVGSIIGSVIYVRSFGTKWFAALTTAGTPSVA